MKKLMLLLPLAAVVVGCDFDSRKFEPANTYEGYTSRWHRFDLDQPIYNKSTFVQTIDHDGHKYIICRAFESVSMLHSEACPCKTSK